MRTLTKRMERIEQQIPKALRDLRPVVYLEDLTDAELEDSIKALEEGREDPLAGYQLKSRVPRRDTELEGMTDEELEREIELLRSGRLNRPARSPNGAAVPALQTVENGCAGVAEGSKISATTAH